jgi:hypothetical protein
VCLGRLEEGAVTTTVVEVPTRSETPVDGGELHVIRCVCIDNACV